MPSTSLVRPGGAGTGNGWPRPARSSRHRSTRCSARWVRASTCRRPCARAGRWRHARPFRLAGGCQRLAERTQAGQLRFGPDAALPPVGGLRLPIDDLNPLRASLLWHRSGGSSSARCGRSGWPGARAHAWPRSLGAHVALEVMRRADATARPAIDAALDALGLLAGVAGGDAERSLRPLAGLIADPAGLELRSAGSLAANPGRSGAVRCPARR